MHTIALAIFVLEPASTYASGPRKAIAMAWADCRTLPPDQQKLVRYLWMGNLPAPSREQFLRMMSFAVNSLSRSPELVAPKVVNAELLRINYLDYAWGDTQLEAWWHLSLVDPYFHVPVKGETPAIPSHLASTEYTALLAATGSAAPIVRADWFLAQMSRQLSLNNRETGAGYYDFLGVKNRDDFFKLVKLSEKDSKEIGKEMRAAVEHSGVAAQNRQVVRFQALTGGMWGTLDNDSSQGEANAIRNLKKGYRHKAEEWIGVLPNGLAVYLLSDADGKLQASAPDFIGPDDSPGRVGRDARIHPGISCVRCHGAEAGLRGIDDWARRNAKAITSPDLRELVELRRQYFSNLQRQLDLDRAIYKDAVFEVNGMTAAANAKAYSDVYNRYVEAGVGPEEAVAELGMVEFLVDTNVRRKLSPVALATLEWIELINACGKLRQKFASHPDPLLAGLAASPPVRIRRDMWEEIFQTALAEVSK